MNTTIARRGGRLPVALFRCVPLLVLGLAFAGCATAPVEMSPRALTGDGEDVSFSDELSRDLVRQTRDLLALREQDYLVGADDVLEISIFEWEMREQTKTLEFRVAESGVISLPALGVVPVAGKTVQAVQKAIEDQIAARALLQTPRVGVSVKEYRSRRISVVGEVNAPGVYAIHENVSTVLDMLTLAGGPKDTAGQIAYVLRAQKKNTAPLRITVDLEELFDKGKFDLNAVLQGGDVVYVPRAPLVYVYGQVRQPGGFSLRRSMRALEAVALAGGFSKNADKRGAFIARREHGRSRRMSVDVVRVERGLDPDVFLRDGDVLHVPISAGGVVMTELWGVVRSIFTFSYELNPP